MIRLLIYVSFRYWSMDRLHQILLRQLAEVARMVLLNMKPIPEHVRTAPADKSPALTESPEAMRKTVQTKESAHLRVVMRRRTTKIQEALIRLRLRQSNVLSSFAAYQTVSLFEISLML